VTSYSVWFDSVNQFHGAYAVDGLNFSIRVDGIFNDELRKKYPNRVIIILLQQPPYGPQGQIYYNLCAVIPSS